MNHIYYQKFLCSLLLMLLSSTLSALTFTPNTSYAICFTPGENCEARIVSQIENAKSSIYVQAYSFTSSSIAKALLDAYRRNLKVQILLDKSQASNNHYSSARFLTNNNIPTWIDYKPAIAHNKVMIFDEQSVLTGSYNFTQAANNRNSENFILIDDKNVARAYLQNWLKRQSQSILVEEYLEKTALTNGRHKRIRTHF